MFERPFRFVVPVLVLAACGDAPRDEARAVALSQGVSTTNHFKALGPNKGAAGTDDALFTPADFEAAAASHPETDSLVYFSRCRRAPFNSTTLYSPFSGANADAIVHDTTF